MTLKECILAAIDCQLINEVEDMEDNQNSAYILESIDTILNLVKARERINNLDLPNPYDNKALNLD